MSSPAYPSNASKDVGLFLLGAVAGSAATLAWSYYVRAPARRAARSCEPKRASVVDEAIPSADRAEREEEVAEEEEKETATNRVANFPTEEERAALVASLLDPPPGFQGFGFSRDDGISDRLQNWTPGSPSDSNGMSNAVHHRNHRRNSMRSDVSSVMSRQSFTIDEETEGDASRRSGRQSFTIDEEAEGETSRQSSRSSSVNESCSSNPGLSRRSSSRNYADNPMSGTNCTVVTEEDWAADDEIIRQARDFDERILSKLSNIEDMQILLRRTRAVNALAHTLALAKDEKSCFEEVSRLLVPLFRIDGCAYNMMKDPETVIVKHVTVSKLEYATKLGLEGGPDGLVTPLKDTAVPLCLSTKKEFYCPRTKESPYPRQRMVYRMGLNTVLLVPILVNAEVFAGCIAACSAREDAFSETDRMLINNVASMLGASIYSKRLKLAAESSSKISREMLHSMIPAKVIEKIECFWDDTTTEYHSRRNSTNSMSNDSSLDDFSEDGNDFANLEDDADDQKSNTSDSLKRQGKKERRRSIKRDHRQSINAKINLLNEMNKPESELENIAGMVIDTSAMELTSTNRALYAETIPNVCIIFTDIVKFSEISMKLPPIRVMNMLQDLFSRFDDLCDGYGIQKLETIGDAYICTTGMFDEDDKNNPNNVVNALGMAKEMVREARRVFIPKKNEIQALEIRVGMHVGEITAGVLGERLPKFTVFGNAVNLAARMEQTSQPNMIRVTKDVFDLFPEHETVQEKEVICVKNMGEVETYLINPLQ